MKFSYSGHSINGRFANMAWQVWLSEVKTFRIWALDRFLLSSVRNVSTFKMRSGKTHFIHVMFQMHLFWMEVSLKSQIVCHNYKAINSIYSRWTRLTNLKCKLQIYCMCTINTCFRKIFILCKVCLWVKIISISWIIELSFRFTIVVLQI